jgi:N-glycosylase/DNA lyase
MTPVLPPHLLALYRTSRDQILTRLDDFARVPRDAWFYELCFCLCTPQSRARHALIVQQTLQAMEYREKGGEVAGILGNKEHYIRFHNTKARRIEWVQRHWREIDGLLASGLPSPQLRDELVATVNGFGLKEASHFLRNIGHRNLAIIDRHLLRCLVECDVLDAVPTVGSRKIYLEIEERFRGFCEGIGVEMDEVDLLFWSSVAGEVLK